MAGRGALSKETIRKPQRQMNGQPSASAADRGDGLGLAEIAAGARQGALSARGGSRSGHNFSDRVASVDSAAQDAAFGLTDWVGGEAERLKDNWVGLKDIAGGFGKQTSLEDALASLGTGPARVGQGWTRPELSTQREGLGQIGSGALDATMVMPFVGPAAEGAGRAVGALSRRVGDPNTLGMGAVFRDLNRMGETRPLIQDAGTNDVARILNEQRRAGDPLSVRWLKGPDGKLYAFDGAKFTHDDVIQELGWGKDSVLGGIEKGEVASTDEFAPIAKAARQARSGEAAQLGENARQNRSAPDSQADLTSKPENGPGALTDYRRPSERLGPDLPPPEAKLPEDAYWNEVNAVRQATRADRTATPEPGALRRPTPQTRAETDLWSPKPISDPFLTPEQIEFVAKYKSTANKAPQSQAFKDGGFKSQGAFSRALGRVSAEGDVRAPHVNRGRTSIDNDRIAKEARAIFEASGGVPRDYAKQIADKTGINVNSVRRGLFSMRMEKDPRVADIPDWGADSLPIGVPNKGTTLGAGGVFDDDNPISQAVGRFVEKFKRGALSGARDARPAIDSFVTGAQRNARFKAGNYNVYMRKSQTPDGPILQLADIERADGKGTINVLPQSERPKSAGFHDLMDAIENSAQSNGYVGVEVENMLNPYLPDVFKRRGYGESFNQNGWGSKAPSAAKRLNPAAHLVDQRAELAGKRFRGEISESDYTDQYYPLAGKIDEARAEHPLNYAPPTSLDDLAPSNAYAPPARTGEPDWSVNKTPSVGDNFDFAAPTAAERMAAADEAMKAPKGALNKPTTLGAGAVFRKTDPERAAKIDGMTGYWRDRTWPDEATARSDILRNYQRHNDSASGRMFGPIDLSLVDDFRFVKSGNSVKVATTRPPKPALEIFDEPSGNAAPVNWNAKDLMNEGTPQSAMKAYGRGKGQASQGYINIDDLPKEKLAGGKNAYSWDELESKRSSPPPATIRINKNGSVSILDGNHRISFWREQGYDQVPVFIIDERTPTRTVGALSVAPDKNTLGAGGVFKGGHWQPVQNSQTHLSPDKKTAALLDFLSGKHPAQISQELGVRDFNSTLATVRKSLRNGDSPESFGLTAEQAQQLLAGKSTGKPTIQNRVYELAQPQADGGVMSVEDIAVQLLKERLSNGSSQSVQAILKNLEDAGRPTAALDKFRARSGDATQVRLQDYDRIKKLAEDGMTPREIAAKIGRTERHVRKVLKDKMLAQRDTLGASPVFGKPKPNLQAGEPGLFTKTKSWTEQNMPTLSDDGPGMRAEFERRIKEAGLSADETNLARAYYQQRLETMRDQNWKPGASKGESETAQAFRRVAETGDADARRAAAAGVRAAEAETRPRAGALTKPAKTAKQERDDYFSHDADALNAILGYGTAGAYATGAALGAHELAKARKPIMQRRAN